jgi:hypothetical protein
VAERSIVFTWFRSGENAAKRTERREAPTDTVQRNPNPDLTDTSFAERQNFTLRMSMRRLTNAFSKKFDSKKFENHCQALAPYFIFYNYCRIHKTLGVTPAMAAGLVERVMHMTDVVGLIDARAAEMPMVRGA